MGGGGAAPPIPILILMKTTYCVIRKEDDSIEARFHSRKQADAYVDSLGSVGEAWGWYEVLTERQWTLRRRPSHPNSRID
jgi:hypothetical protein